MYGPSLSEKAYFEIANYQKVSVRVNVCWKHRRD